MCVYKCVYVYMCDVCMCIWGVCGVQGVSVCVCVCADKPNRNPALITHPVVPLIVCSAPPKLWYTVSGRLDRGTQMCLGRRLQELRFKVGSRIGVRGEVRVRLSVSVGMHTPIHPYPHTPRYAGVHLTSNP